MRQTANATIIDKILNNNVYPAMFQESHSKGRRLLDYWISFNASKYVFIEDSIEEIEIW